MLNIVKDTIYDVIYLSALAGLSIFNRYLGLANDINRYSSEDIRYSLSPKKPLNLKIQPSSLTINFLENVDINTLLFHHLIRL